MEWLIGIILPPFIDYVNKNIVSSEEKVWITVITCFVIAAVLDWNIVQHASVTDVQQVLTLTGVILAEAMTVYQLYWKNSKLRQVLPGNGVEDQ